MQANPRQNQEHQEHPAQDPSLESGSGRIYRTKRAIEISAEPEELFALWTRFERLHETFDGVRRVKVIGPGRVLWDVDLAGVQLVWEARIIDWEPNRRLAWKSFWGPRHQGEVRLTRVGELRTRLEVEIEYEAVGLLQRIAGWLDLVGQQLETELMLFQRLIARRPVPDLEHESERHAA